MNATSKSSAPSDAAVLDDQETGDDNAGERTRRIVEAAYDLLNDEGLEGLTIRAVLKKTGLSRRAFYERFEGKDDLMLAVFEQTIRLAAAHYSDEFRILPDPMARVKFVVSSMALGESNLKGQTDPSHRRSAALSREHLRLAESRPHDLQAALSPLIALIAEQLEEGMKLGMVRKMPPLRLAWLVYNLVSTTAHTEFLSQESAPPDRARRAEINADVWDFCQRAIEAK